LVGWGGRRAPHAERAVILPAVQSLRLAGTEGACEKARVRSLACPVLVGRAGRRAPHAERAVILPAVQSLRLAGSEGAGWKRGLWGGRVGVLRTQREL
jgi:hypothetical protein